MRTGDIVRRGDRFFIVGNEIDKAGRRLFWRMGPVRTAMYFRPSGFKSTGYNIHTRGLTDAYN